MKDLRGPYVWQSVAALRAIRSHFGKARGATAVAVYVAMTEIANEKRKRDDWSLSKRELADRALVSERTVDTYLPEFAAIGLLQMDRTVRADGGNATNRYALLEPAPPGATTAPTPGATTAPHFSRRGSGNSDVDVLPSSPQKKEEAPGAPPDVQTLWQAYLDAFGEQARSRSLTQDRIKLLQRSLREQSLDTCLAAIRGAKAWHDEHEPSRREDIGFVFASHPGSKPLFDSIASWARRAEEAADESQALPPDPRNVPLHLRLQDAIRQRIANGDDPSFEIALLRERGFATSVTDDEPRFTPLPSEERS